MLRWGSSGCDPRVVRVIIDTDPAMGAKGGDPEDSFAILLALNSPEVEVVGVTVVQGNVPVDHGYPNAVHLLELVGCRDVPVLAGVELPMNPSRKKQIEGLERRREMPRLVPRREPAPGDPQPCYTAGHPRVTAPLPALAFGAFLVHRLVESTTIAP